MRTLYIAHSGQADEVEIRNDELYPWFAKMGFDCVGKDNDEHLIPEMYTAAVEEKVRRVNERFLCDLHVEWR